ncbi:MAG: hypothetical protein KDD06_26070 [Phaeodactylibacter sp.]|nr:hypothetical protein [Phaeodactylibacter sp.]
MKSTYIPFLNLMLALFLTSSAFGHSFTNGNLNEPDTILLIRLQDGEVEVAALLEAEAYEKAHVVAAEREMMNRSIMQRFDGAGQVYFFYAYHTEEVLQGLFDKALIFDARKRPADVRQLAGRSFLVVDPIDVKETLSLHSFEPTPAKEGLSYRN